MTPAINRRRFNLALAGATAATVAPAYVRAQATRLKVGVLLPRSGVQGSSASPARKGRISHPAC